MRRISASESAEILELARTIDPLLLRTLLSDEQKRLMRPERLENLESGKGRLSDAEAARLQEVRTNRQSIRNLARKTGGKQPFKDRHAIRTWVRKGKSKGVEFKDQNIEKRHEQLAAIRALRFLGIDPSDGTYYVKRRT